jgi:hypothetical protein
VSRVCSKEGSPTWCGEIEKWRVPACTDPGICFSIRPVCSFVPIFPSWRGISGIPQENRTIVKVDPTANLREN